MATTNSTRFVLWTIYLALLGVLLPHTAWAFSAFEPADAARYGGATVIAWSAAVAFEAAIAALTHRLAQHIDAAPNHRRLSTRLRVRYANEYTGGLLMAVGVSSLANLAHAVEFAQPLAIVAGRPWLFGVYVAAFGAVLPVSSLLFAAVLSSSAAAGATEEQPDPALEKAKAELRELRAALRQSGEQLHAAEARFQAAGDLMVAFTAESKRDRILAIAGRWPELPQSGVAVLAGASVSYVSETLQGVQS